jgi:CBS domain-containing protein
MRHVKVADVMTPKVVTVDIDTPFKEITRVLTERRISAVPVPDRGGHLVGIVSEEDLLRKEQYHEDAEPRRLVSRGERRSRAKAAGDFAGDVLTAPVLTIDPSASLVDAAKLMTRHTLSGSRWLGPRAWSALSAAPICCGCSFARTPRSRRRSAPRSCSGRSSRSPPTR